MRVILDANIYISALISDKVNPAKIIRWWLDGKFELLVSAAIKDELLRVSSYERIQRKYANVKENRLEFIALVSEQAIWAEPPAALSIIAADETDNRYLECAIAGGAQYIVTGDDHLIELGDYRGVAIILPAAFVALLEAGHL